MVSLHNLPTSHSTLIRGPRGQFNRSGYPRKNYYNNHNGPRNHSLANNPSYHYNPHIQQSVPLVTVPHSIQPVNDTGYMAGVQESHYSVNGNHVNHSPDKGQGSLSTQRVPAPVPHHGLHPCPPVVVNSSVTFPGPGLGFHTHGYNSFKPQSQTSETPPVNNSSSNSYQPPPPGPRATKPHSKPQQLNYQVPEFVPSSSVITKAPVVVETENPIPVVETNATVEPIAPVQAVQQPMSNGHHNATAKGTSKVVPSVGNLKGARNKRGHRRDGDNASNCSGTSGQSESYSRNGDERNGQRHKDRREHNHGRGTRNEPHSNEVFAHPTFDLKDAAFPPLPFSTVPNDPPTIENSDLNSPEPNDHPFGNSSTACATGGCLADVVKGISISKNECNRSEASQKSFDSSSSDVIECKSVIPDPECNGNGPSHDLGSGSDAEIKTNVPNNSEESQNRWVRPPPRASSQQDQRHVEMPELNGKIKNMSLEVTQPCNGHESSDNDDQAKVFVNSVGQSSKLMSFADVARLAKAKQTDNHSFCQSTQLGWKGIN